MLRVILSKLTSKRGASLSMALMLLLVCTTVAGVALTAATVVAGRQARTKDVDKSYYNVTSAAKLFWDEMRESHVVVSATRSCATSDGTSQSIDPNSWTCTIDGVDAVTFPLRPANASLFQLATCDLLFGTGTALPRHFLMCYLIRQALSILLYYKTRNHFCRTMSIMGTTLSRRD